MEETLRRILHELRELRRGQEALRSDFASLQRGQEALRNDVVNLQQGQEALRSDVVNLQRGQARLEKGFESLRADVTSLQQGQAALQKQLARLELRMETEVFDEIKALFDARQVHLDYFEELRRALARIEDKLHARDELLLLRSNRDAE